MARYIRSIKVKKLYHLHDITIPVGDEGSHNLLLTGKNGSGKTVLLNAVAEALEIMKDDKDLVFTGYQDSIELEFEDVVDVVSRYNEDKFIIAFYTADRKAVFDVPKSIQKPDIAKKTRIGIKTTNQLLYFLAHNKIQELLAKGQGKKEKSLPISRWFDDFEKLLKRLFDDDNLSLTFNQEDYSFAIETEGKRFGFNQLSDGYAAVLDIVADLILRMQGRDGVMANYEMGGIVLIDEVETHLHLELQKSIMPLLTTLFPNIQFIVSTHSPFVLSSLKNATAYDLENREAVSGLTDYSFDSLAEGYFGVTNESGYIQDQLSLMEELLNEEMLMDSQKNDLKRMLEDFNRIPAALAPMVVGQYRTLLNNYAEKIKSLGL